MTKLFPIFRTPREKKAPYVIYGLGEPGIKRGTSFNFVVRIMETYANFYVLGSQASRSRSRYSFAAEIVSTLNVIRLHTKYSWDHVAASER